MRIDSLQDLLIYQLMDQYDAERLLLQSLPGVLRRVHSDALRDVLSTNLDETRQHIDRLDGVFDELRRSPTGSRSSGMEALLDQVRELMSANIDHFVLDSALIAALQRAEHYEIASYGTTSLHARLLGLDGVADVLTETLSEEKVSDAELTRIAQAQVNEMARRAS